MPLINMFVFHVHKDNALSLETIGFFRIDPEASLEEFFRLKRIMQTLKEFKKELIGLQGNMLNFALTLTINKEAAKDLTQETNLRTLDNLLTLTLSNSQFFNLL